MILDSYITWFKAHERLVLLTTVGVFGVYFYNHYLDYAIKHDQQQAQVANQQAQIAANKVESDQEANIALIKQISVLQAQTTALENKLNLAMQQRAVQTQAQKKIDDSASASQLAARIRDILGVGNITVQPTSSQAQSELVFSLDAAHENADRLEDGIQAKADVQDLKTQLNACKTINTEDGKLITGLNNQISDDKIALTSEQKAHEDDIKTLKAENRKKWLNGFKWGAIAGFVGGLFIHKP